jgi:hypothetical protein
MQVPEEAAERAAGRSVCCVQVLDLLALLVQKYKY